ncbi:MAG TPA: ATP-dependent helicase [Thermoanaerobaculia bacterium]|nr:ATP-dependent helicase [Thermoanaerobaculia bacterium]
MAKIRKYHLKKPARSRAYSVNYASELNEQQLEVVEAAGGPMLVIAGAGSGKTRALTYRVSRLIEDGVNPSDILLLTFTNKASREMLSRVEELVTVDTRQIWGGTFHSVGNRLLRRYTEVLGYRSNFSILDQEDAKEMMESAISASIAETLVKRFPKGDVLLDIHSFLSNTNTPLELQLEENYPHFAIYAEEIRDVFRHYGQRKRDANVMDFDDLLLNWKKILDEHPEVGDPLRMRFRHILVDEYQDTNKLQADIVDSMASVRRNVMVVGDDAQSIYSFRGASFENIITFPLRFPDAVIHKLELNYRSTPQILSLANAAIANNRFQFRKELQSSRGDGPDPALVGVDDVYEQASFVAQRILELRDEGEKLGDMAVLYRSHYQSLELQIELTKRLIPYEIRSGVRFFEQAHIKDVIAYLKIVTNSRDELSWKRAMKLYPKIGEKIAAEVWAAIGKSVDPLERFLAGGLEVKGRAASGSIDSLRSTLRLLASEAIKRNPAESIRIIMDNGYADYVRSKFPNASARLDDLEQLSQYALRYDDVVTFLEEVALANPISGEDVAAVGPEDEKVVLSSIHQSKGLEWRIVFIIWLSEGRFPSARAMRVPGGIIRFTPSTVPASLALPGLIEEGIEGGSDPEVPREIVIPGEEEERRLFYVGVTRAQQELYLVFPVMARDRNQMDVLMEPSRFLRELDGDLYEKWIIGE